MIICVKEIFCIDTIWKISLISDNLFSFILVSKHGRTLEERQTIIACGAGSTTKLVLPEKIKTSSGKETNLIRVENVKNITEYIDRIDEMIERKKALFEKD